MLTTVSFAQEATPETEETEKKSTTEISGGLDVYSKYGYKNGLTSFTGSQGSLEIGMAAVRVEHQTGKVGAVIDLGFGKRSEEFTFTETNSTAKIVNEAFLTYEIVDDLVLTGGYFQTHMKYESFRAQDNKNYSMSYMFSNGPFLNAGIKANYQLNDEFGVMIGATLPTDYRTISAANSSQKTLIAQLNYAVEKTSAVFNFTTGSADGMVMYNTTQFDIVLNHEFSNDFLLGFNATYQTRNWDVTNINKSWLGAAVYATYAIENNLDLNYRFEFFDDSDALTGTFANTAGVGGNIFSNTLSANYKVGNLTIIPELRGDLASVGIFQARRANIYGLVAAVYAF